jgi:hypothetical protein
MVLTIHIHDSWGAHPGPLSRLLAQLAALEHPAPWTPEPARQPGDDGDDLASLLDGIDQPEPAPSPARPLASRQSVPAARSAPRPAAASATPPATGQSLYKFCCRADVLRQCNAIGKRNGWPKLITQWDAAMVATAYAELIATAQPTTAGTGRTR